MRYFRYVVGLAAAASLALVISVSGCGKGKNTEAGAGDLDKFQQGPQVNVGAKKTELPSMGYGSLAGLVTYEDGKPQVESLKPRMEQQNDAKHCLQGKEEEHIEQTWIVGGPHNGVANVVIFLKAPAGKFFKIKTTKVEKPVELHQPHCAFLPHVIALYPSYYDGEKNTYVPTGQQLKIINDAEISHNTKISGGDPARGNESVNKTLLPGRSESLVFNPQPKPLELACNFHNWMSGTAWVFDHPYHAVSKGEAKGDKADDFGKYDIPEVPAGVEIDVVAWHAGTFLWGESGKKMTFKDGEKKELNFSIKKK